MIKVSICDDENTQQEYLHGVVKEWAAKNKLSIRINCYPTAEAFLFAYEDDKSVDILLLDIQMGEMDGVNLAKKIRKDNKAVQIIFATGYTQYISEGYDVEALHYLTKPIDKDKLFAVLERAMVKLSQAERVLWVTHEGTNTRIPLIEIRAIEVLGNYATIYANEEIRVKKTLSSIESELDDRFFRAGRSYIVNIKCIRKVKKNEVELEGGQTVPLSRGMYDKINRALIEIL